MLLERIKKDNIKYINLQFSDVTGMVKSVTIPASKAREALKEGVWFDGSSIEGFMRIHESDMYLMPDPKTYAVIPWSSSEQGKIARFICDIYTPDGTPFEGDPRHVLKKAVREAAKMGFVYNVGPEPEFFLFRKENGITPLFHDTGGYFDLSMDKAFEIRNEMMNALEAFGIKAEASHHEVAVGQHEIDFEYSDALRTADNVITFKFTLKAIAAKHDLHATFMPKPLFGINGSGMHCHQSLSKAGKNVFYDPDDEYNMSKLAKHFIAGQLRHIRSIAGITNPLVNSYKRLTLGYEAPVYICWAKTNRSSLIRIPRFAEGKEGSARAEIRCPDPCCNPYLAFAVMLNAGLKGIKAGLEPPEPVEEDVYHFDDAKLKELYIETMPGSLGEAIGLLKESKVAQETIGPSFLSRYIAMKTREWDAYRIRVHKWELDRYMEKY